MSTQHCSLSFSITLTMAVRVLLLATLLHVTASVDVFKCCPLDSFLNDDGSCSPGVPEELYDWVPVVVSPTKGLVTPGTYPTDWTFKENRPKCKSPTFYTSSVSVELLVPPSFFIFENGSLKIMDYPDEPPAEPGEYCINPAGFLTCANSPEAEGIVSGPPKPKVKKCCGANAVYSEVMQSCRVSSVNLEISNFTFVQGFPKCSEVGVFAISGKLDENHKLLPDGVLLFHNKTVADFCLERLFERPIDEPSVFTCPTQPADTKDIRFTLFPMGLFLSVFFLAVTLIASCLLPSTYHVLHWRCQTNHVACLMLGDLLLAITQLSGDSLKGPMCVGIAITMHFMFLAAFFWLNTMCFNIWWTFRDLRPASLDKGQEVCRLRFYELYAWGGPLLISGLGAVVHHLPEESATFLEMKLIRPHFGKMRCWFEGNKEIFAYFFGPIGVLLLLNLTLFAATARELTCGLWKTEVVKSNTERATLGRVCLKLVVVMGITWIADVASWVIGGPHYIWYLTDMINALQGVLIFAVVGCQPQVWAAVKRLWCLRDTPSEGNNARSSSSHAMPSCGDQNTSTTKALETLC